MNHLILRPPLSPPSKGGELFKVICDKFEQRVLPLLKGKTDGVKNMSIKNSNITLN